MFFPFVHCGHLEFHSNGTILFRALSKSGDEITMLKITGLDLSEFGKKPDRMVDIHLGSYCIRSSVHFDLKTNPRNMPPKKTSKRKRKKVEYNSF